MSGAGARPAIRPERYAERLARAQALANSQGLAAVLVGVGADLRYFTGYNALPLERLTLLVIPASGDPRLVVPRLEAAPARGCPAVAAGDVDVSAWEETEDPVALVGRLVHAIPGSADDRGIRMAVSDRLWAMFVLRLQAALPLAHFTLGSALSRELRIVKDPEEIELLGEHQALIDLVHKGHRLEAANHIRDVHWSFKVQEDFVLKNYPAITEPEE